MFFTKFFREWYRGVRSGRVTTLFSLPVLADAFIKIAYSFDSDPQTVTVWPDALTGLAIGLGVMAAPSLPNSEDDESAPATPPKRKRKS